MNLRFLAFFFLLLLGTNCKDIPEKQKVAAVKKEETPIKLEDTLIKKEVPKKALKSLKEVQDSTFIRLADYDDGFAYEMRYATEDNFLKAQEKKWGTHSFF